VPLLREEEVEVELGAKPFVEVDAASVELRAFGRAGSDPATAEGSAS
jgi:hypothetical protein